MVSYSAVSNASFKKILPLLKIRKIPRDYYFINEGKREENEYFILEGIVRSNLFTKNGEDVTISFYFEKSVLPPHSSRALNNISALNFQSLTPVTFASINARKFRDLMRENKDIYLFASSVMAAELQIKTRKEINLATLPAKERLIKLREQFPSLENLVPHSYIASYLGITPVSLSRLRKET
jgi:CRP-like cAMP-binding protein